MMKNLFKGKKGFIYTSGNRTSLIPFGFTVTEIKQAIRHHKLFSARLDLIYLLNKRVIKLQPIDYNARCKELILKLSEHFALSDILDFIFDVDCGYDYGESDFSLMEDKLEKFFNT